MAQERKLATMLFADIVGSTGYTGSREPELVRSELKGAFERTRAILVRQIHDEDFHVSYLARALERLAQDGRAAEVERGLRRAHTHYEEVVDVSYRRLRARLLPDLAA